jgi:hypothetical protein
MFGITRVLILNFHRAGASNNRVVRRRTNRI